MPKITLAQFESKLCDPPANVVKAIPMIRQAGLDGSDMIMFPEMFTTGYELSIVGPRITELAEPVNGPTITALREAAKQAGVYVVAPIALYHDDLPGVPFNSAVLIDREGNVRVSTTSSICGPWRGSISGAATALPCSKPTSAPSAS
mgnify:CR=1 FL=1